MSIKIWLVGEDNPSGRNRVWNDSGARDRARPAFNNLHRGPP